MTLNEIQERVKRIRETAWDDEAAHGSEDGLRADVLRAIAAGDLTGKSARDVARLALSTDEIDFARWCA